MDQSDPGILTSDFGQVADVHQPPEGQPEVMHIVITLEKRGPPAGVVEVTDPDRTTAEHAAREHVAQKVRFTGWLDLLAALAAIIEPAGPADDHD